MNKGRLVNSWLIARFDFVIDNISGIGFGFGHLRGPMVHFRFLRRQRLEHVAIVPHVKVAIQRVSDLSSP